MGRWLANPTHPGWREGYGWQDWRTTTAPPGPLFPVCGALYQVFSVKRPRRLVGLVVKGATSQVAGSPAVPDRTVIVLDRTIIVLDRTVIVLDRTVTAIYGILSLNFLQPGGGSDRLWLLRAARHTSAPALPTVSCLSDDR